MNDKLVIQNPLIVGFERIPVENSACLLCYAKQQQRGEICRELCKYQTR